MYMGVMREKVGTKRHNHKLIAEEYQRYVFSLTFSKNAPFFISTYFRLNRDDAAFESLYKNANGQSALIKAIHDNMRALGLSSMVTRGRCRQATSDDDDESHNLSF